MSYVVYILYSDSTNVFYKGQTSDMNARLMRHNNGLEKSTKSGSPWILIWVTEKKSRSEAMGLERKLKNLSREKLIEFINKYNDGIAGPDAQVRMLTEASAFKSRHPPQIFLPDL